MPPLPVLDKRPADGGISDTCIAGPTEAKKTFKLSQLDLGSIGVADTNTKRPGGRKREVASAALDDDDDPLEEAQVKILLSLLGSHYF